MSFADESFTFDVKAMNEEDYGVQIVTITLKDEVGAENEYKLTVNVRRNSTVEEEELSESESLASDSLSLLFLAFIFSIISLSAFRFFFLSFLSFICLKISSYSYFSLSIAESV